jgi:hypothetical protein
MPRTRTVYKQIGPLRRSVSGENTFSKGMQWNKQVNPPETFRWALNYYIDPVTFALRSSPGWAASQEVALSAEIGRNNIIQFLRYADEFRGIAYNLNGNVNTLQAFSNNQTRTQVIPGVPTRVNEYPETFGKALFDSNPMKTPPVTHGFNNQSFVYTRSGQEVARMRFIEKSETGQLSVTTLEPREMLPSEATQWGYNMYADNPYIFENATDVNLPPAILGVLFMDSPNPAEAKPVLTPKINTQIYLYIYYRGLYETVPPVNPDEELVQPKYVFEITQQAEGDTWQTLTLLSTIETLHYLNNTSNGPIIIPFTGTLPQTIIRLNIIDTSQMIQSMTGEGAVTTSTGASKTQEDGTGSTAPITHKTLTYCILIEPKLVGRNWDGYRGIQLGLKPELGFNKIEDTTLANGVRRMKYTQIVPTGSMVSSFPEALWKGTATGPADEYRGLVSESEWNQQWYATGNENPATNLPGFSNIITSVKVSDNTTIYAKITQKVYSWPPVIA